MSHDVTAVSHGVAQVSRDVAVVSHGVREAIEFFELSGTDGTLAARWIGCIPLPPDAVGNDVVFGTDGAILVTDYQPARTGPAAAYYAIVAGLGGVTGEVLRKPAGDLQPRTLRFVHPRAGEPARRVLVEARRGARPDVKVLAPLYVHDGEQHSAETRRMLGEE